LNDTPLYNYYKQGKLRLLEEEEYVEIVVDQLEILSKNIVVQRLTGDAPRNKLVGPMWSTNKKVILNRIDKMLKERNSCQGSQVEKVLE
jgi:radical SAM superfamily enzyme